MGKLPRISGKEMVKLLQRLGFQVIFTQNVDTCAGERREKNCRNFSQDRQLCFLSQLLNWIERWPPKPKVAGSNPAGDTRFYVQNRT
jgi:hypothetical protein